MDTIRILQFVGAYVLVATVTCMFATLRHYRGAMALACVTMMGVAAVAILCDIRSSGSYFVLELLADVTTSAGATVAVVFGLGMALPWLLLPLLLRRQGLANAQSFVFAVVFTSIMLTTLCTGAYVWRDSVGESQTIPGSSVDSRFVITRVADFSRGSTADEMGALPINVTVDEHDNVFVSVRMHGQEELGGRIYRLSSGSAKSPATMHVSLIADCPLLFRTFGLAVRHGDIFVSRSGLMAHASRGAVGYDNCGAVTRLRDLDRDGIMDWYDDILTNLPGAQGPVIQHQNNGIAFDKDGCLYVLQGFPSNRDLATHPWHGCLLRLSPDFENVHVVARGLRNPFGLVHDKLGNLFVTDNDVSGSGSPGDELNLIKDGRHYGHPYVVGADTGEGEFEAPLLIGEKYGSSFAGIAYTNSVNLPSKFRDCLYIADFSGGRILRVPIAREPNGQVSVTATPFVSVPYPIDVAVTSRGDFFVTTIRGSVFRISYVAAQDGGEEPNHAA